MGPMTDPWRSPVDKVKLEEEWEPNTIPSEEDIFKRLQILKGVKNSIGKKHIQPSRVTADQVENLLHEVSEELAIGQHWSQLNNLMKDEPRNSDDLIKSTRLQMSKERFKKEIDEKKDLEIINRLEELKKFNSGNMSFNLT
ncbi:hypothetical protein HELRODRAFT_173163 [Helobdella robusta]|uniref:Uncharacterized protein n=1 Tax=Helobdella robusta TaxID=6412 RepID=T1F6H4_HELRO|nr:hypothetical protein HELRODRAFT_173163 [Helobdella robusta]ESO04086.1 hypothetical protein HELRODRAFT_173163 [Helobdella robusta]